MRFLASILIVFSLTSCQNPESSTDEENLSSKLPDAENTVSTDDIVEKVESSSNSDTDTTAEVSDTASSEEENVQENQPSNDEQSDPVSLTGSNYFGSFEDFSYSLVSNANCGSDDYKLVGFGAVTYDSGYQIDLDNSGHSESSSYAMYYSDLKSCLIAAATGVGSSNFKYWYTWEGIDSKDDLTDGAQVSSGSMLVTSSYFSSQTIEYEGKNYISEQYFVCRGPSAYLKLEDTGDSLDNFMTKQADWVFGFTLKQDWELWGGLLKCLLMPVLRELWGTLV